MENKFLKRFDLVKTRFNNKLKDNLFKEEIEAFIKYNIIDENNMFNYIYIHNIYQYLIENPYKYKINIISKNKEQITQFIYQLFNEKEINIINNKKFIYETYINFNDKKIINNLYNLYSYDKDRQLLLKDKTIKEIEEYLNQNNINNLLITSKDFEFNTYPSIQFNFLFEGEEKIIKDNLEKEYIEKNEKINSIEKNILNEYFSNKNSLYLNDQIYYRDSLLLSTINIFLYEDEEWDKNKESIIEKISIKNIKGYKDILITNIICNFNKKILYYIEKEREGNLFHSNSSNVGVEDDDNFNLFDSIYNQTYSHFKNEMNYIKTSLSNFNSLINDHMKITFNDKNPLKNNNINDYFKNSITSLIKSEEEVYLQDRKKLYEEFINNSKNEIINNLTAIKQEIDEKYIITNSTFNNLQEEISKWMAEYEKQVFDFFKEIDNLNIKIFYDFKKILNEQGIFSLNFDGLIKVVAIERISIKDPIKNIIQKHKHSFGQILASFGISGVVGGTASFLAGRAASIIGADAAAGTFGGPIGIGVGVVVGVGTLIGQAGIYYKKNRELINSFYEDMNKNVMETINNVEDSVKKEMEKINNSMEKDIQEIKKFINILIDRTIKIFTE